MTGVAAIVLVVLLTVGVALLSVVVVLEFRARDRFEEGFEAGFHSQLGKRAKQRYHRAVDCVFFIVSKDEYDREIDDLRR